MVDDDETTKGAPTNGMGHKESQEAGRMDEEAGNVGLPDWPLGPHLCRVAD